jgi:hypothetical protein
VADSDLLRSSELAERVGSVQYTDLQLNIDLVIEPFGQCASSCGSRAINLEHGTVFLVTETCLSQGLLS